MRNPGIMFCHQFTGGVVTFRFVKNKDMCVCYLPCICMQITRYTCIYRCTLHTYVLFFNMATVYR